MMFKLFYGLIIDYPMIKKYDFLFNESGDYLGLKNLQLKGVIKKVYGNGRYGLVIKVKPIFFDTINKYEFSGSKGYYYDKTNNFIWIYRDPLFFKEFSRFKKDKKIMKDFGDVEFTIINQKKFQLPHE